MASNSITQWLNSRRDYKLGVALFKVYGNDETLLKVFAQGHSDYRQGRLVSELTELAKTKGNMAEPIAAKEPKFEAVTFTEQQMPENSFDPKQDPYREKWMPHYKAMQNLCARLRDFENDEMRGEACFEILRLEEICQDYWNRADYYRRTGQHLPERKDKTIEHVTDPNAYAVKLMNLRSYISKARKLLKIDPNNIKAANRLKKYEQERDYLEHKLNIING